MKKETPLSGIVYDSYNDKTWNFERFFEILADYYEGKPLTMAEDLVQAIRVFTTNDLEDIKKIEFQNTAANLFTLREAVLGIEQVN